MGLDQTLRIIKPVEQKYVDEFKKGVVTYERYLELEDNSLQFVLKEGLDEDFHKSLHKLAVPCKVEREYLNIKKALEDLYPGIDFDKVEHCMTSYCEEYIREVYANYETKERYEIIIDDDFERKYSFSQTDDMYAFNINTEVAYWRKDYNLHHYMESVLGFEGQNCYYFPLNMKQIDKIIEDLEYAIENIHDKRTQENFGFSEKDLSDLGVDMYIDSARNTLKKFQNAIDGIDFENEVVCYHEWY